MTFSTDNKSSKSCAEVSLRAICAALSGEAAIQPTDKLNHNLMLTIERHRASLDWLIESRSTGRVRPRVRRILQWALAELLWFDGVPAAAVVSIAVEYAKKRFAGGDASFINAFLRRMTRDLQSSSLDAILAAAPACVACDLPELLWKRWLSNYGEEGARQLCAVIQQKASVTLRCRQWPAPTAEAPSALIPIPAPDWAPWAELYTPSSETLPLDEIMQSGDFYIQDAATLLAPTLLAPMPGEYVGDFCCAPGGKSRVILEMLKGTGHLLSADKSSKKLPIVRQNLAGFDNVDIIQADAAEYEFGMLDAILLDVPCSNTGVIRRKPDVRWSFSDEKLAELTDLQMRILENAAKAVRIGGRIVYSTCSIEPDENQLLIRRFLEKHSDFSLKSERLLLPTAEHDGAYAALLTK